MARRKKRRTPRPRAPARTKRRKQTRGHHHPELIGLGLLAAGVFLAVVLYLGWDGGQVGGWIADGLGDLLGYAVYVLPISRRSAG